MKKLFLLLLFLTSISVKSQTDSLKYAQLDSLTPDQLLQHYINEPEPYPFYRGPDVGDSVFYVLRPLTVPTNTVDAEPLSIRKYADGGATSTDSFLGPDTSNTADQKFKPKISLGSGRLAFHGDLYS